MRGFLSLEPDDATQAQLVAIQNRLHDGLARQGVHFPDRLGPTLLAWPFGRAEELSEAARLLAGIPVPHLQLGSLEARPNAERPGEIGLSIERLEAVQAQLYDRLRRALDPDPPKPAFVRLVRVSPPSRKVGAALRAVHTDAATTFVARSLGLWAQTPTGFALRQEIPMERP